MAGAWGVVSTRSEVLRGRELARDAGEPAEFGAVLREHVAPARRSTGFEQHFGHVKAHMRHVEHHLAHAISAYAYSGFDDAAVVVMDGRGAWEATSIWHGHGGRLEHVLTIPFPDSVGCLQRIYGVFGLSPE